MIFTYNNLFNSTLRTRHKLDRRRLEDAHLKYALLLIVADYPDVFNKLDMMVSSNIQETLQSITSKYYCGFQNRYASEKCKNFT